MKKIYVELFYNKSNVSKDFSPYLQNVSYTDYEAGQSDELTVTLKDNDKLFQNSWYPQKGASLTCKVHFGEKEVLNCGKFVIDEISFNFSTDGDTCEIKALATTPKKPLRTNNTTYYSNTTLFDIAKKIGEKYGFDVEGGSDVYVDRVNQVEETDLNFLRRLAKKYGYVFKITDNLLVFIKESELQKSKTAFTLTKFDITNLSISDESTKKYKACSVNYFDPSSKKMCTYTASREAGEDTLKLTKKCKSKDEAKKIAEANLKNGSKEIKGNIALNKTNVLFIAGVNFNIEGFGRYDGKYHIKQSSHNISSDSWEITGEIEKC